MESGCFFPICQKDSKKGMKIDRMILKNLHPFFLSGFVCLFSFLTSCTNYSSTKAQQAPPILINVEATAPNTYRITARAQNPELLFQGYRLYPGPTTSISRNPGDLNNGIDCFGGVPQLPNLPFEYTYTITPDAGPPPNGVTCRFVADLGPGTFVTVRSLLLSLTVDNGFLNFSPSGPSNTIILPSFTPPPPE